MKRKIVLAVVIVNILSGVFSHNLSAQIKKGSTLVESSFGNISFSKNSSKNEFKSVISSQSESNYFSFTLYPRFGYFLSDKLVVGGELDFYYSRSLYEYTDKDGYKTSEYRYLTSTVGLLPLARYYFLNLNEGKLFLYGQLSGGYSVDLNNKSDGTYYDKAGAITGTSEYDYTKDYSVWSGMGIVGANYFIADNVALNFGLGYQYRKTNQAYRYLSTDAAGVATITDEYENSYITRGINWSMGFTMFIPSK